MHINVGTLSGLEIVRSEIDNDIERGVPVRYKEVD